MTTARTSAVLRHIRELSSRPPSTTDDRRLLERFTTNCDQAAFEALVRRHGSMVLDVCRRVLHNAHDAEDAFQATFLVLARKAGSIRKRESIGGWLYRVGYHMALKAREQAATRQKRETRAIPLTAEFHSRIAQSGFEQWFRDATPEGAPPPAAWKMNMIVLLTLYPVVFLWGLLVGTPILTKVLNLDFPVALFIGNVFSVLFTSYLVPWTANRLGWWLAPAKAGRTLVNLQGAGLLVAAYAIMILLFWKVL